MITEVKGRTWALAIAAIAAMLIAGCGDDDSGGTDSTAASGSDGVAAAEERLEDLYEGVSFQEPPSDAPAPPEGANVWLIPFGLEAPEGADWAEAGERSAELLGWDATVFDGKFTPDQYLEGIRAAIADDADAIGLYVIDCAAVKAGLEEAEEAGVAVVAAQGADCDEGKDGGAALFDESVGYTQGDFAEWGRALGAAQADWIISKTGGDAKAIEFYETDAFITVEMHEGFVEQMGTCSTCEIVETVEFLATDFGSKLQQKAEQAILNNPDANAVAVPYDGVMTAGIAPAVQSSGRKDQLEVIAGVGLEPNIELIRDNGGQDAGYGVSVLWEAYSTMDTINRVLNGEEQAPSGNGIAIFDRERGMPESGAWEPPVDFVAAYEESWAAAREK